MAPDVPYDFAFVTALVLAAVYALTPQIEHLLERWTPIVASVGGGAAVAYVFLELFPEIYHSHAALGDAIFPLILVSFLGYFVIEQRLHIKAVARSVTADAGHHDPDGILFWIHFGLTWFYVWLIIYSLPVAAHHSLFFAILTGLALSFHTIYKDIVLRDNHHSTFGRSGRYLLVLAPVAGWLSRSIGEQPELMVEISLAVMAGLLIQSVFREEIPGYEAILLRWFIGGAAVYGTLVVILVW